MKKLVLLLSLTFTALSAYADLGDTYKTSCQRYGSRGTVSENNWIVWHVVEPTKNGITYDSYISEQFHGDQCVVIRYVSAQTGLIYAESEVWRMLQMNSAGQVWRHYGDNDYGNPEYVSNDGRLYAMLRDKGATLEIAYKSWSIGTASSRRMTTTRRQRRTRFKAQSQAGPLTREAP